VARLLDKKFHIMIEVSHFNNCAITTISTAMMYIKNYSSLLFLVLSLLIVGGCGRPVATQRISRKKPPSEQEQMVPAKGIKQTNLEEALWCKTYYKNQQDLELTAKYLEHALTLAKDHKLCSEIILELADTYKELSKQNQASKYYNQYKTFYPGSSKIKYVLYQEMMTTYEDSHESTKDQTKTKTALKLAQEYLQEFPDEPEYTPEVLALIAKSRIKLLKHELQAAQFYLQKYSWDHKETSLNAAHRRVDHFVKEYLSYLPQAESLCARKSTIDSSNPDEYAKSLEEFLNYVTLYVDEHEEKQQTFLNKLNQLSVSKRHGRFVEKTGS
jgi:outer membrane assembly lipoprotein YfiO